MVNPRRHAWVLTHSHSNTSKPGGLVLAITIHLSVGNLRPVPAGQVTGMFQTNINFPRIKVIPGDTEGGDASYQRGQVYRSSQSKVSGDQGDGWLINQSLCQRPEEEVLAPQQQGGRERQETHLEAWPVVCEAAETNNISCRSAGKNPLLRAASHLYTCGVAYIHTVTNN